MKLFSHARAFLVLFTCFFFVGFWAAIYFEKGSMVLWLNEHHSPLLDGFFVFTTQMGEGLFFVTLLIALLWKRFGDTLFVALTWLISGLSVQLLKRTAFTDYPRPSKYFENLDLHFVEGVEMANWMSFPSGHTATAFAMFLAVAIIFNRPVLSILMFAGAVMVAISRVYLTQHFLGDVVAGAAIGVSFALIIHCFFQNSATIKSANWLNRSFRKKQNNDG